MRNLLLLASCTLLTVPYLAPAQENWPQFRGPQSRGVGQPNPSLPDTWSAKDNVVWQTTVLGRGWSSPIVWGDKIFVTAVINEGKNTAPKKGLYFGGENKKPPESVHRWVVYCLDFQTGNILWEREAHKGVPATTVHIKNSYASETPATDGERVYVVFGNVGVFCYDLDGKLVWSEKLGPYRTQYGWGTAASPVVHKGRLYVINDNEEQSSLVALDAKTGKEIWRVNREEKSNWSTPFIWENEQRTEIVTPGTGKTRSYDLDGKLLWELTGASNITIPTPFSEFGLLFTGSGYVLSKNKPLFAIRPGASGDISIKPEETQGKYIAWCQWDGAPYNPSFLVYGDYCYVLYDRGFLSCFEARTGKPVYEKQRLSGSAFTSSPWAYNGRVFCLSEDGDTIVVQAGPEFKLLGKNKLDEMCLATPAIAHGSLILRTESKVYRLQKQGK
jgi:outer membrane protein assembly factor BamB